MADELNFERASHRIARFLVWVAAAGTALAGAAGGWKWAAGFLAGSIAAWLNFHWLKRLVRALGGNAAPSSSRLALLYFLVGVGAYVILRFSPIPAAAVIIGLLALIVAVFIELVFELVYARKRTLDHQDL
jgi:hypothetical protein